MTTDAADDRRLARRLATRDQEAFTSFFDAAFPRLYRFALARLDGDQEAAADIAQETLVRGLDRMGEFRGESSLHSWLFGICRHCIADLVRRRHGRFATVERLQQNIHLRELYARRAPHCRSGPCLRRSETRSAL